MGGGRHAFASGQVEVLGKIARGTPLADALDAIVRLIEEQAPGMLCSIVLVDPATPPATRHIRHAAAPSLPRDYVRALDGAPIGPEAGSCGAAAHLGQLVVVEDIATHPYWKAYRDLALPHGLRACWSMPILSPDHDVLGTFAMYHRAVRGPTEEELELVSRAADLASIAIVRDRDERSLRETEARSRQLARLYAVSSSVSEASVRIREPALLYEAACRIAVEKGLARLAWIGLYDEVDDRLRPVARFGADDGYVDGIALRLRDEQVLRGPAAAALESRAAVISNDLATDPSFHWKDEALRRGLRALAVFPLQPRGRPVGVLMIYGDQPGFFRDEEVIVLEELAGTISFAVESADNERERSRLLTALNERVKELTALHRVSRVLQQNRTVDTALLAEIVAAIPEGWRAPDLCAARLRWEGMEAATPGWAETPHRLEAPLAAGEGHRGTIEVAYPGALPAGHGDPFLPEERELVRSLADMLSSHFGRVLAEQALAGRAERLRLLDELGQVMRSTIDADEVMPIALGLLGRHLRVARCTYAEVGPDGETLVIPHGYTDGVARVIGKVRLSQFGPALAAALRRGETPVVVRDVTVDQPPGDDPAPFLALEIRAHLACSLIRQGELRAVMAVHSKTPRDWTPSEVSLFREFADRCWATIEQRAAEDKLRRNEALLRIAGQAARLGAWTIELPEVRLTLSDEVCAIHEIPAGTTLTPEQAIAFYAPEFRETIYRAFEACVVEGSPFDLELQIVTATERRVWVRAIGRAERGPSGAITRVLGAFQDIDERRRLEEQLGQTQKMEAIGRLASGVAHDFNNLLSVILSYASFLVDSLAPGDPMRDDIAEIQKAGARAGQLTRQLLALGRQQLLQPRVISPSQVVRGVESMLRRLVGEDVILAVRDPGAVGQVLADPGQLERVILNLAINARDAMPRGGSLTVELDSIVVDDTHLADVPAGRYVVLSLSDTGTGMDAATRSRIFEPFFTTKDRGKGAGLGLSTVYGIVTQSGGHVRVASEPGAGTTFRIYLPQVDQPPEAVTLDEAARAPRGDETVLVVEDDEQVRAIVASILRRAGYHVLEAQNAGEALLVSESVGAPIHLLLSDVVMPRMSGRELAARLAPTRPAMRVLYMSGYADETLGSLGALEPSVALLHKPITPNVLLHAVRDVLDTPSLTSRAAAHVRPQVEARHVLVVDDEEALVSLTARILGRLGYQVTSFTDPRAALSAFRDDPQRFDALVTDVSMRGMNGFELAREILRARPGLPIVLTSGDFRPEHLRDAAELGIAELVAKPATIEELGRILGDLLAHDDAARRSVSPR